MGASHTLPALKQMQGGRFESPAHRTQASQPWHVQHLLLTNNHTLSHPPFRVLSINVCAIPATSASTTAATAVALQKLAQHSRHAVVGSPVQRRASACRAPGQGRQCATTSRSAMPWWAAQCNAERPPAGVRRGDFAPGLWPSAQQSARLQGASSARAMCSDLAM